MEDNTRVLHKKQRKIKSFHLQNQNFISKSRG